VRLGEDEVLESPSQVAIGSRVTDRDTHVGELGLSVYRRGVGLVDAHASMLKDILSILALVQKEVVMSLLHWDTEEVVEGTQVLHSELPLSGVNKASGLAAIDRLNEGVVKEGVFDIQLVHRAAPVEG
jgi:hypothetical protein